MGEGRGGEREKGMTEGKREEVREGGDRDSVREIKRNRQRKL